MLTLIIQVEVLTRRLDTHTLSSQERLEMDVNRYVNTLIQSLSHTHLFEEIARQGEYVKEGRVSER